MFERLSYVIEWGENKRQLEHAPIEWDEGALKFSRSTKYWGITREFSLPNRFVKDGADILRSIFYNGSTESKANLLIYRFIGLEEGYSLEYQGELDFSTFVDFGDSVEIDLADNGIEADINANEDVSYEFPLEEADCFVRMRNIEEVRKAKGNILMEYPNPKITIRSPSIIISDDSQLQSNIVEVQSTQADEYSNFNSVLNDNNWFLKVNDLRPMKLQVSISVRDFQRGVVTNNNAIWAIINQNKQLIDWVTIYQDGDYFMDLTINANVGDKFYMSFFNDLQMNQVRNIAGFNILENSTIEISYNRGDATAFDVPAFRAYTLFDKLIQKMRSKFTKTQSNALKNEFKNIKITCGDWIRSSSGVELNNPRMITSFKDFFQSLRSATGIAFGVEDDVCVIENLEYFLRSSLKIDTIENGEDFEIESSRDLLVPKLKAGYKDQNYDLEQGRFEFNSEQEYTTGLQRSSGSLDLISAYRADQYGIDKIRVDIEDSNGKDKDKDGDKDVWMLWTKNNEIDDNLYQIETSQDFDSVDFTGGNNRVVNIELSPKRMIYRNGAYLHSIGFGQGGLVFRSGKKNTELTTSRNGQLIRENADFLFENAKDALFLPLLLKFTAPISYKNFISLKNKNLGFFEVKYKNVYLKGFVMNVEANISYTDDVDIELLLTADNDLTQLI